MVRNKVRVSYGLELATFRLWVWQDF